jgi:hypothetical protein
MPNRSLLILPSFLLKEACGRLQKLLGVVFVRLDIGWGYRASLKCKKMQVVGQRDDARKTLGLM